MSERIENDIHRDLFTICSHWKALLDLPRAPSGHTTGTHEPPLPLPVGILSLRRESGEQLAAWAHLIYEERDLNGVIDLLDTIAVCRFLDHHADWLAAHAAGRDAAHEIGAIATQVVELVKATRAHRIIIGGCPDCAGTIVALIRPSDALLPSQIRCDTGGHTWTPWEWHALGYRLRRGWDEDATRRLAASIGM